MNTQRPLRYAMIAARLLLLLPTMAAYAAAASGATELSENPLLQTDAQGQGSIVIILASTGGAQETWDLTLGEFKRTGTDNDRPVSTVHALGTPVVIQSTGVGASDRKPLNETQTPATTSPQRYKVTLSVQGLIDPGQYEATLKNGGETLGVVKAIRVPGTFNVQIVSATPDSPEVQVSGRPGLFWDLEALVQLKNSDPFPSRFRWKLFLKGRLLPGDKEPITIPPNGTVFLDIAKALPETWKLTDLLTSGTLKNEALNGQLVLEPVIEGSVIGPLPPKLLNTTFRLSYWSQNLQELANIVFLFVVLFLGGGLSIIANYGFPNTTRALALRKSLDGLQAKVAGLEQELDSRWRVLLKAQIGAVRQELNLRVEQWHSIAWTWLRWALPSFSNRLDVLTSRTEMIQQWVEVTYGVGMVLHQAGQANPDLPGGMPPTVLRWIGEHCEAALTPITTGYTKPEELESMKTALAAAQEQLNITLAGKANTPPGERNSGTRKGLYPRGSRGPDERIPRVLRFDRSNEEDGAHTVRS
jgi:hypothetical protein